MDGYTEFGAEFTDDSTKGVGNFSDDVSEGATIGGTLSFTTGANTQSSSIWSLSLEELYDTASGLSAVSGAYMEALPPDTAGTDPMEGATMTIMGLGSISGQGGTSGCVLSGSVTVTNAKYDIYGITYKLSECTGKFAVLNGVQFASLADVNRDLSAGQILVGANGQVSGANYAMVLSLSTTTT
jgi:hypothetical protein